MYPVVQERQQNADSRYRCVLCRVVTYIVGATTVNKQRLSLGTPCICAYAHSFAAGLCQFDCSANQILHHAFPVSRFFPHHITITISPERVKSDLNPAAHSTPDAQKGNAQRSEVVSRAGHKHDFPCFNPRRFRGGNTLGNTELLSSSRRPSRLV